MSEKLNIIISGYGKMGKTVEKVALNRKHNIIARLDNDDDWEKLPEKLPVHTVVIDFSMPGTVVNNLMRCFDKQLPVVTGTTGWYDRFDEVSEICKTKKGTLLYAPNFSIGVHVLFHLNRELARIMSKIEGYKVSIKEIHHIHKLDAPSGTAIQLANDIIERNKRYNKWISGDASAKRILPVISERVGEVPGTHEILYNSDVDSLLLKHEAKSREGFAVGAVLAAEFVYDKKGVFSINDLLKTLGL